MEFFITQGNIMSNEILTKEFPNKLQDFIDEKGWSIAETARQSRLAEKTIKKMLNGEKTVRNSKIKVAKPFGISAKEIFPNVPEL